MKLLRSLSTDRFVYALAIDWLRLHPATIPLPTDLVFLLTASPILSLRGAACTSIDIAVSLFPVAVPLTFASEYVIPYRAVELNEVPEHDKCMVAIRVQDLLLDESFLCRSKA